MKKLVVAAAGATLAVLMAAPAFAHVTIQPNEAIVGSFSRFVVRVPNESEGASTIEVRVELPPLAFPSFEPKDGWERRERTGEFDEPIDAFGEEITEGVTSVTWSGGQIGPGEFAEFGFSVRMPAEPTTLEFKAVQTYDDGEVVRWTGAPDSDQPAPLLTTYDIGAEEGEGQLAVIARLSATVAELEEQVASDGGASSAEADSESDDAEDDDDNDLGVVLGGAGLGLGGIALILALIAMRRKAA